MKIWQLLIVFHFFAFSSSITHTNSVISNSEESKIFQKNSFEVPPTAYLDKDNFGKTLIQREQKIDNDVGVEGSSKHYTSNNGGADSSTIIYELPY